MIPNVYPFDKNYIDEIILLIMKVKEIIFLFRVHCTCTV